MNSFDPLFKVKESTQLDARTKRSIAAKLRNVLTSVKQIEELTGLEYPPYYVEPVLTVVETQDNIGGLGVLYARTIPVETNGIVQIVIQLSAPLVLFATKAGIKIVLAHEFLHYVELVKNFSKTDIFSQSSANSIYEEKYSDYSRAEDPSTVFGKNKKLIRDLSVKTSAGYADVKLDEKCKVKWLEKGKPTVKMPIGKNQVKISVDSIIRTRFDERIKKLVQKNELESYKAY